MMARIKLIVTGTMEKQALPSALAKFFPKIRNGKTVSWEEARKVDGFTSYPLPNFNAQPARAARSLASAMVTEARTAKQGPRADLIVALDDVELGNLGREANIAAHFRAAVKSHIKELKLSNADEIDLRAKLQENCSFHLLKPMIEAYLFADTTALKVAGMTSKPHLCHATDVEQFKTNGPPEWLTQCRAQNQQKAAAKKTWWREECHPKQYLLHFNPNYEETDHGKNSLLALDFMKVVQIPTNSPLARDAPLFCALIQDLADWFDMENPLANPGTPDPAFYPDATVYRNTLLLRNM